MNKLAMTANHHSVDNIISNIRGYHTSEGSNINSNQFNSANRSSSSSINSITNNNTNRSSSSRSNARAAQSPLEERLIDNEYSNFI
jgi:hypothetical protein